ncbi:polypeptide N-acetylgalactosaminyltransferase-like 6 [Macrobrachium rosenbergii]|uniref:polypeptide N-acetylgalactosaminyltransferase-like 6 n=1 Tax=Macrobrachium rosenbergii TaxID=79674 RepID=UPI0034D403FA
MRLVRRKCKAHLFQLLFMFLFLHFLRSRMEMREISGEEGDESDKEREEEQQLIVPEEAEDIAAINGPVADEERRDPSCRSLRLTRRIDPITIVVPFCEEPLEVLLDVLRSIKDNTWKKMIYEIVFMKGNCKGSLPMLDIEAALEKEYDEVVLVRAGSERGIMEGRRKAPIYTAADQLVFVDVHSRFTPDWLRPLLEMLALSNNNIVAPMVETFDPRTGRYQVPYNGSFTGFDWYLRPRVMPLPEVYRSKLPTPFLSPVIPSPVFAVKKDFYISLGTHDPAISTWVPAQLELSLKTWLCNGHVLVVPCSRVLMPHSSLDFSSDYKDLLGYKRIVQAWMSVSQRQYVFRRRQDLLSIDAGSLQGLMTLKDNLECKPWEYYLSDVAADLTKIFPLEEPRPFARGNIRSAVRNDACVTSRGKEGDHLLLATCSEKRNQSQLWSLDWRNLLKSSDELLCWTANQDSKEVPVLEECSTAEAVPQGQIWMYEPNSGHIQNGRSKKCLTMKENSDFLGQEACDEESENQMWIFDFVNLNHTSKGQ